MAPAAGVELGDRAEHLELLRVDLAVRDLHPDHLVGPALALAVDALVQAGDPKDVFGKLTREVLLDRHLEPNDLIVDHGIEVAGLAALRD